MKSKRKHEPPIVEEIKIDTDFSLIMMSEPPGNPPGPGSSPSPGRKHQPLDSPFGGGW